MHSISTPAVVQRGARKPDHVIAQVMQGSTLQKKKQYQLGKRKDRFSYMQGISLREGKQRAWRHHRRQYHSFLHLLVRYGLDDPNDLEPWFPKLYKPGLTALDAL